MQNFIAKESCTNCGICADICPADLILKDNDGITNFSSEFQHICVKCGQCMAVCPTQSVQVVGLSYEKNLFPLIKPEFGYNEFNNFLSSRRSVRNFKDKPVEKESIQKIIDSMALTPFGMNPQSIHITVVTNKSILQSSLKLMADFYNKLEKWMKNPIARTMMKRSMAPAVFSTVKNHIIPMIQTGHYNLESGDDNILRNAPALMIFHAPVNAEEHFEDAMICVTYASLAAHSLELGATMIGLVAPAVNKTPELKKLFNIPENHEAVISLIIGHPKFKYKRAIKREKENVNWID